MLNELRKVIKEKQLQNVEVVTMVYEGTDQSQIMKWLEYAVEQGWEGLMLNKDAIYKCKRTTDLIISFLDSASELITPVPILKFSPSDRLSMFFLISSPS